MNRYRQFTDNKLIILYVLNSVNIPLTDLQINRIIWDFDFMNYFDFQQCLYELQESGMVDYFKQRHGKFYEITEDGIETLKLFQDRIRFSFRQRIDEYSKAHRDDLMKETQLTAKYVRQEDKSYTVECNIIENDDLIFSVHVNVPSVEEAQTVCKNWPDAASLVYQFMLRETLTGKTDDPSDPAGHSLSNPS